MIKRRIESKWGMINRNFIFIRNKLPIRKIYIKNIKKKKTFKELSFTRFI